MSQTLDGSFPGQQPPAQVPNWRWPTQQEALFLKLQRPDIFNIYEHVLLNKYEGENKYRAMMMIMNELDRIAAMGYNFSSPQNMQRLHDIQSNMDSSQAQHQQPMYGFHQQSHHPTGGYDYSQTLGMNHATHEDQSHDMLTDEFINYGGENMDNTGH
jgi:hypothetical protein